MLTVLVSTISNSQVFLLKNVSSFCKCKSYSHFFSKNISVYAIFNDQSFNNTLTNDIVSFEQLGPECLEHIIIDIAQSLRFFLAKSVDSFLISQQKCMLLVSTLNIYSFQEIRKILCGYPLLYVAIVHIFSTFDKHVRSAKLDIRH